MGTFHWPVEVSSPGGSRFETVEALVDTGASHTVLPSGMLRRLGAVPYRTVLRRIADGGRIPREIGETKLRVNGLEATRIVAFGDDDPPPLLGADTLQGILLAVDPVEDLLVPTDALLLCNM
jgi:predicted aspartyl protease